MATLLKTGSRPGSTKSHRRHSITVRSSRPSSKHSVNSSIRSEIRLTELRNLKDRLVLQWEIYEIPHDHRELFMKKLHRVPFVTAKQLINIELEEISNGTSLILNACRLIKTREHILEELLNFSQPSNELLEEYRQVTLNTLETIGAWFQSYELTNRTFHWNGINYIQKCRDDTSRLRNLQLKNLHFDNPFLLKSVPSVSVSSDTLNTHRRMSFATRRFRLQTKTRRKKIKRLSESVLPMDFEAEMSRITTIDLVEPMKLTKEQIKQLTKLFAEEFLIESMESWFEELALSSCSEVLSAALSLHSSTVLDKCLTEVLDLLIPEVAREALEEERSREYISIRDMVFAEVFANELRSVVIQVFNTLVADSTSVWILNRVDLENIVREAIQEETMEKLRLLEGISEDLIADFVQGEWVEELVEGQVNQARLDQAREGLPLNLQKEIFRSGKHSVFQRVSEEVYYDMLHTFVSGYWLHGLATSVFRELSGKSPLPENSIFLLQDPKLDIEALKEEAGRSLKKSVYFRQSL